MAIGLGFDAINGEHNRRTLWRILAQPIYRDALLFGKFLAGLATLSISLIGLWLLVIGLGLIMLGVPPGGEEMARAFVFLLVTIAYAGVWLALAMLFSVMFRSAATAALVTLGLWLFLTVIWPALAPAIARSARADQRPGDRRSSPRRCWRGCRPRRCSARSCWRCCIPTTRALGPVYLSQLQGAVMGAPLPLSAERADRLAADRRPDRRDHPVVRRRLYRVPAPGGASVSRVRVILRLGVDTRRALSR